MATTYPETPGTAGYSTGTDAEMPDVTTARTGDGLQPNGDELLQRVVQGAHQTIDRLAERAAPHVHKLQSGVSGANEMLHTKTDEWREKGDEWTDSLRETVRDNPLAAVATALAVGMLIARLTR
ncbi:MAG: hypothetical protein MZW92_48515 [Comamonadaceae bacterium]|nr:hypothetical protein [Comamonadaceae bacterium]